LKKAAERKKGQEQLYVRRHLLKFASLVSHKSC
jgi:hypothetical protein